MTKPLFTIDASRPISRRRFVLATSSLAAAAVWADRALGVTRRNARLSDYPFQLGLTSGDPTPTGVVLWTRLAPKPLEGGGMPNEAVEVRWQVADDEKMSRVVRSGTTTATPDWGHSVHVEVDGLEPDRWYFYQFQAAGETSPVGRTRTMPAADAKLERLRFAFASCQHWEQGLYTGYDHMLRENLDLVLHLGDYIYESAAKQNPLRTHVGPLLTRLDDYRNRHAQYKTDPHLAAMHAGAPWIVTWDDHEFANNCAGAISERADEPPEIYLPRRAAAYQAYYEHMPLRRTALPRGPDMKLYRRVSFGQLAEFFVLDTRQYRTDQPCGDGNKPPCDEVMDPKGTVLGEQQERWLFDGLSASPAAWNVLAQQIMIARVDRSPGEAVTHSMDQWPGYEVNRRRVLKFLHDRKVRNPVTIAGDIHTNWANNLIADFDDLDSVVVAAEFVGTSISSSGDGVDKPKTLEQTLAENPFVKFHNSQRGYVTCEVTPKQMRTEFRTLDYVSKAGSPIRTRASFVVEDGKPGVEPA